MNDDTRDKADSDLEKRAYEWALSKLDGFHGASTLSIMQVAYETGTRAERERQQWMFDSWKKEEADWIAENVRLREALEEMVFAGREAYDNGYPAMEEAVVRAREALGKDNP